MSKLDIISLSVIAVFLLLIIMIIRSIINKAVKKYVIPKLERKGLFYIKYKWAGLIDPGDFKSNKPRVFYFLSMRGSPNIAIFAFIYYEDNGIKKRMTIKIDTTFFLIKNVLYSVVI